MDVDTTELSFDQIIPGAPPSAGRPAALRPEIIGLTTDILAPHDLAGLAADWRQLEIRALETNAFYASDFALSASQHFREGQAPHVLAVWDHSSGAPRLSGLFPFHKPRHEFTGTILRGWTHPFAALGAPLIDRHNATAVITAALDGMARAYPDLSAYLMTGLPLDGPVHKAFERVAAARGSERSILLRTSRALFDGSGLRSEQAGKHGKELRRKQRRLAELGPLTFEVAETYADLKSATEQFLTLEAQGWKGQNGTALVQTPEHSNFVRMMLWSAARRGQVRIATLNIGTEAVASTILLTAGRRGFLWKIAYAEAYARFSPGSLLIDALSHWMRNQSEIETLDSCATQGHQMIESHWDARIDLVDTIYSLKPGRSPGYLACLARERMRRSLRARAKSIYRALRGEG